MAPRSSANGTTIRDSDRAAELAKLKAAKEKDKKAADRAARDAAAAAAATPQGAKPPASAYVTPASVTTAAQAAATSNAARVFPPSCRVEIERLVPAWPGCRGYLETVDTDTIRAYGLKEYLRETWGGERFKVTVIDTEGAPLWSASDVFVAGKPRHYGAEVQAPRAIDSSPPIWSPPPAPNPAAVPPPAMASASTAAPAAAQLTRDERAELFGMIRRLTDTNAALLVELDRSRSSTTPAGVAGGGQDIAGVFKTARATLDAAREFSDEVQAVAGPPPASARDRDDDDDRHSPIAKEFMRGLARKIGNSMWGPDEDQRQRNDGRSPPPNSGRVDVAEGGTVVDGEPLH